ncbi:hypothetical protein [Micromonospora sp. LOL_023]|uniref:hypothetical protein n=1 Tax=Micromonospora sp. LOL_023 TaxID=3345418 RepID=UPI003A89BC87
MARPLADSGRATPGPNHRSLPWQYGDQGRSWIPLRELWSAESGAVAQVGARAERADAAALAGTGAGAGVTSPAIRRRRGLAARQRPGTAPWVIPVRPTRPPPVVIHLRHGRLNLL